MIFYHPDCTVGLGISPSQSHKRVAGYTAGQDLRPLGRSPCPEDPLQLNTLAKGHLPVNVALSS